MNTSSQYPTSAGDTTSTLRVAQAQDLMRERLSVVTETEVLHLTDALGRVLAHDVVSPIDVPAHDNSAMDGYALASADLALHEARTLSVVGTALAGRPWLGDLPPGCCVRIMTGAVMPDGADTVLPQELALERSATHLRLAAGVLKPGDNRRHRGEDLQRGHPALTQGRLLRPADLGLLASLGVDTLRVRKRLRVALFSTGDELRSLGQTLEPGCIYDSNRYTVRSMLQRLGCDLVDLGVVPDDAAALEATLRHACTQADAIITSGGVSVGEADYTRTVMQQLGDVAFWTIAMRPGRPMAFGRVRHEDQSAWFFGLPGNPVAVMVTFYFLVRDALLQLMGAHASALPRLRAQAQGAIRKRPGRTEYQRAILSTDAQGTPGVAITGSQGSGVLRSMAEANCMVVLDHDQGDVHAGDWVPVVVFDGLI